LRRGTEEAEPQTGDRRWHKALSHLERGGKRRGDNVVHHCWAPLGKGKERFVSARGGNSCQKKRGKGPLTKGDIMG